MCFSYIAAETFLAVLLTFLVSISSLMYLSYHRLNVCVSNVVMTLCDTSSDKILRHIVCKI